MVAPLVLGGLAIGSGVAQWMTSESARKAGEAERAQMKALLGKVQDPSFDTSMISPIEYKVLEKYIPQVAEYVAEKEPALVEAASEGAVAGRDAQMKALERYRNLSETGDDEFSKILRAEALQDSQIQNNAQQQQILQTMERRGAAPGSGLMFAQQLAGQQQAANQGAAASRDAAKQAYATRLEALRNSASLGGQIRNEDVSLESRNKDIINSFNQRNAANRNAYNQYAAGLQNQGNLYNIERNQQAYDQTNEARRNEQLRLQQLRNGTAQQRYNNTMAKTGQFNQISQSKIDAGYQSARDTNNAISGLSKGLSAAYMYEPSKAAGTDWGGMQKATTAQYDYGDDDAFKTAQNDPWGN